MTENTNNNNSTFGLTIIDSQKIFCTPEGANLKKNSFFNSDLEFNIPNLYQNNDVLYATIKCLHAEIPYSFYIVNEYNNLLSITDKHNEIQNIFIPFGNYNANAMLSYLNTVLPSGMTISFNTRNGKYTLTYNHSFSVNSNSTCYILLGFVKGVTYSSTTFLEFPFLANLLGSKNIYLKINNLILDNFNTQTGDRSTLSNIPVNVPPYGLVFYENRSTTSTIIKNIQLPDTLYIQLTDDENNLIDFNNSSWSITIQIDFYIKKNI